NGLHVEVATMFSCADSPLPLRNDLSRLPQCPMQSSLNRLVPKLPIMISRTLHVRMRVLFFDEKIPEPAIDIQQKIFRSTSHVDIRQWAARFIPLSNQSLRVFIAAQNVF